MANLKIQARQRQIVKLLLENRGGGTDWGYPFSRPDGKQWSKRLANRFLLCSLLDYQIPTNKAWENGDRLIKSILGNPDDIWRAITSVSETKWRSKRAEYRLHRFPAAHDRRWRIASRISDEYKGDARQIWRGKDPMTALESLSSLGTGNQLSRMVVGALRDCNQITGTSSDVKGDIYVRRVLGRALLGEVIDPVTAVRLAGQLYPTDPWQLDAQLWSVGKSYCLVGEPRCSQCYLLPHCTYVLMRSQGESPK